MNRLCFHLFFATRIVDFTYFKRVFCVFRLDFGTLVSIVSLLMALETLDVFHVFFGGEACRFLVTTKRRPVDEFASSFFLKLDAL